MPSIDYFLLGHPETTKQALAAALAEHGFAIEAQLPNGGWTVARGSKGMTVAFGALAGRNKQRLEYTVHFFDHQGQLVARFFRDSGAGAMGGAIGVSRSNDVFAEVSQAVHHRLAQQGLLSGAVQGA